MNVVGSFRLLRHRLLIVSAVATAVLLGVLATGFFMQRASSQSAPVTLRACVSYYTGGMRMLNRASATCNTGEYLVEWNQQGPQGAEGIQGIQGPPGPPTYMDTYIVTTRYEIGSEGGEEGGGGDGRSLDQVSTDSFMAFCQPGDDLLSGGYELIADGDMVSPPVVLTNRPFIDTPSSGGGDSDEGGESTPGVTEEGWIVSVEHSGLNGIDVWAVCNTDGETDPA